MDGFRPKPASTEGYSMKDGLSLLYDELSTVVNEHEKAKKKKWGNYFCMFHHGNLKSTFHWTSLLLLIVLAGSLLLAFVICNLSYEDKSGHGWWLAEFAVIIVMVAANVAYNVWDGKVANEELINAAKLTLNKLEGCISRNTWNTRNFPNIHSPLTPCVSLQWTLRDKELVNIPIPLLVKGDVILLRPGQEVPAECQLLEQESCENSDTILSQGEIYSPQKEESRGDPKTPQGRKPFSPKKFCLLETPFVKHLRMILEDKAERPVSVMEKERYTVGTYCIERRLLPCILVVMLIVNIVRYVYLSSQTGHWAEMVLVLPTHALLPLLPLMLPLAWHLLNCYGQARVFAVFHVAKDTKIACEDSFSSDSCISEDEARVDMDWKLVLVWFRMVLTGHTPTPTRRVNVSHILGSVTSLCCVDKKGLLSWPNPTAEKVFFLTPHKQNQSTEKFLESGGSSEKKSSKTDKHEDIQVYECPSHVEVLDLTHDAKNVFGLRFDDPSWGTHLNSLKPLGLNILLNTCNDKTVEWYTQFTDHVACEALENEETVAVVNRRCLCELAKQIGFSENAVDIFAMERVLGIYKHVHPDESAKERLHRAKSFIQHKIPMPNMVSIVAQEKTSGISQVLSQGTADILLSCCTDYWNGQDVCYMVENDRKKVLDFYHRTSMASYCTAFSYRPLTQHISSHLEDAYLQLSHGCGDIGTLSCNDSPRDSYLDLSFDSKKLLDSSRTLSVDSLFDNTSTSSIEDIAGCFEAQNNQIFIGMVSMQYQARQDFVQLIDKLEVACIRFVHFSQENEVRSRVFSEKMGLEAGWNCHISLLSDKKTKMDASSGTRASSQVELSQRISHFSSRHSSDTVAKDTNMSADVSHKHSYESMHSRTQSAPSIVNLESSQVRFEMNTESDVRQVRMSKVDDVNERTPLTTLEDSPFTDDCVIRNGYNQDMDNCTDIDSRHASSYFTENTDSLTGALDNRAKLPRGIDNIRPHLKCVDNVPLLVNLFTDCTTQTTQEMIQIMQDYEQVVLCVGSSVNIQNTSLFLQADCSLGVEPLYPQVCCRHQVMVDPWSEEQPTPTQIASALICIPCSLSFRMDDNIGLIKLIAEARSFQMCTRNCFYLMLCYHLSVSLIQVLASLALLPPILASQHLMWLLLVVIPLLCVSMMGLPVDPRVMNNATSNNSEHINKDVVLQFISYFTLRFVPAVLVSLFCFGLTLYSFCTENSSAQCVLYDISDNNTTSPVLWYDTFSGGLVLAQNVSSFFLSLYFVVISVSFVHWSDHVWQQLPFTNKLWSINVIIILITQIVFCACDVMIRGAGLQHTMSLSSLHPAIYTVGLCFPLIIILINELVKRHEVRLYVRYQKKTRLNFGTKLGMNSPF